MVLRSDGGWPVTTLEDDIARIAALRGRPVENYTTARTLRTLSPQLLQIVFSMTAEGVRQDLRAYDRLPEAARRFVSESTNQINAEVFGALVENADGDVERVEDAIAPLQAAKSKAWLLRHYGRDHPNLRKYA